MDKNRPEINPKVSVIIPVFNTEDYLEESVRSIMNQTLHEIEIIIRVC
jgi:glycosyltransferase involved in cell wall biosynthesis